MKGLLLALGPKKKGEDAEDEGMGESTEGKVSAAQDMLDAAKAGDAEAYAAALEDFIRICEEEKYAEDDEEPDA